MCQKHPQNWSITKCSLIIYQILMKTLQPLWKTFRKSSKDWTKRVIWRRGMLGGETPNIFGIFTPKIAEMMMIQFDLRIFFKWVGKTTNQVVSWIINHHCSLIIPSIGVVTLRSHEYQYHNWVVVSNIFFSSLFGEDSDKQLGVSETTFSTTTPGRSGAREGCSPPHRAGCGIAGGGSFEMGICRGWNPTLLYGDYFRNYYKDLYYHLGLPPTQ